MEIQWNNFYQNLLLKGEVGEVMVHSGVNRAMAVLHPGAVYQGRVLPSSSSQVRISTPSIGNLEAKVR